MARRGRRAHPEPPTDAVEVGSRPQGVLREGDLVQMTDPRLNKYTITLQAGASTHTHRGHIEHDTLIGLLDGNVVMSSREVPFLVLRPMLDDYVLGMPREAAVVYPKDAVRIAGLAGAQAGARIIEAGAGSGSLSCYLLSGVGTSGALMSIERRSDFAEVAAQNVRRWFGGFPTNWTITTGDFNDEAPADHTWDGVVLDMLAPWECLEAAHLSLRPGGALVGYVATATQLSTLVESIRVHDKWIEPRAEELMLRTWHLDGLSVRPDHKMNGHTGFLVATRALSAGVSAPRRARRPAPTAYGADYDGPRAEGAVPPADSDISG